MTTEIKPTSPTICIEFDDGWGINLNAYYNIREININYTWHGVVKFVITLDTSIKEDVLEDDEIIKTEFIKRVSTDSGTFKPIKLDGVFMNVDDLSIDETTIKLNVMELIIGGKVAQ